MMVLYTSLGRLQQPLEKLNLMYHSIKSILVDSEKLLELFSQKPNVIDRPDAIPLEPCCGDIEFQNVSFSYSSNLENDLKESVLNDISFRCKPGTTTALVGESGSGKSTIFNILYRFYNLQNGSIWVDGHDLQGVTVDSLRKHISVVPQEQFLFNETLMYNLKYGNHGATDQAVYEACKAACIHNMIMGLPDKYETYVGNRGMRLSGGQKQRISIARALLRKTKIILLDEATASLDSNTETQIKDSLNTLFDDHTLLVIAHRLSTITAANQILVFHEGRIVERGTHRQLYNLEGGRYAKMWSQHIRGSSRSDGVC